MEIKTNGMDYKISQKQARYFAISVYRHMKQYIAEHRAEYEEWLENEGKKYE